MSAIGIDLGTTNSCAAVWRNGAAEVLKDIEGPLVTPSIVAARETGEILVGWPAKRESELNPGHTYRAAKRLIGRGYDDEQTRRMAEKAAFEIVRADNGEAWIAGRDHAMPPSQISGLVLTRLKRAAERALGRAVTKAVITTPAYFNDAQRKATRDAAAVAGLDVLRIVNEPTAAAIAAELTPSGEGLVAVYDLGGGTFDLSVLRAAGGGEFEVLASNGDTFLGGDDFDARLIDWAAEAFLAEHGVDLRRDKLMLQRLTDEAERVKRALSETETARFSLPFIGLEPTARAGAERAPLHLDLQITRAEFEAMTADLIARTAELCAAALEDAGVGAEEIGQLLLVGGMTRMPAVQAAAEQCFPGAVVKAPDPDQIVARGAAMLAAALTGELAIELADVTPHAIGVETADRAMAVLAPAQTRIPATIKRAFTTAEDGQGAVTVRLRQGNSPDAVENLALGQFHLEGVRSAPAGAARIDVTVEIDVDGIVTASAKDRATGRANNITAEAAGLAPKAVSRMAKSARAIELNPAPKEEAPAP